MSISIIMIRGGLSPRRLATAFRKGQRFFSSAQRPKQYGYECTSFADLDSERTILERSLRNGLQSIVTRSRENYIQTYELLFDLSEMEDCDMNSLYIGHIFGALPPVSGANATDKWITEVEEINKLLSISKRTLNFLNIPLHAQKQQWNKQSITESIQSLQAVGIKADTQGRSRFGLDINTALLASASSSDIETLITTVLQPLVQEGHLKSLSVASNPLTYHHASTLTQWANKQNKEIGADIHLIATEVLRCHSRKPGLLSGGYPLSIPHRMASKTIDAPAEDVATSALLATKSAEMIARMRSIEVAASDFQMALDRCIHTEKIFLSKQGAVQSSSGVAVTDVCLAHVLTKTYAQFQYPEEWQFVHANQIEPKLERGLKLLADRGPETKDWATIYQPMSKYLVSSFRHLLQEKSLLQAQEALELLQHSTHSDSTVSKSTAGTAGADDVSSLPEALARFTAQWTGAHCVALSQVQVDADKWLGRGAASNVSVSQMTAAQAQDINSKLRSLLVEGDH